MVDTGSETSVSNPFHCGQDEKNIQYSSYFSNNVSSTTYPQMRISGADIKVKELILVTLALLLLVTSLCLFYKNWKKNYRDINQLPYYSYMYKIETPPPTVTRVVPARAPVMHWAKAAAAIGTGLAFSTPGTNRSNSAGLWYIFSIPILCYFFFLCYSMS